MDIILKQDVTGVGYANEIVTVKDGFARNYLIPQGMAILATKSARKAHEELLRQKSYKEEKIRKESTALAEALEGLTVRIGAKASSNGKIFGSVNALQIADALKEQFNYDVDRKKIFVDGSSIKELGTYNADVKLHKEIGAKISFEVFAE